MRLRRLVVRSAVQAALLVALLASPVTAGVPCWHPPVVAPVTDPFRAPRCSWCPGNRGIEYATRSGAVVRAAATGVVTFSGVVARVRYVVVEVSGDWRITYGQLESTTLRRGDPVVVGTSIGRAGTRIHLGVRAGDRYVDPAPMLGRWTYRPRLIPVDGSPGAAPGPPRLRCG